MPFVVEPSKSLGREVPRVVRRRLKMAISLLDELDPSRPDDIDRIVHDVRKRCKEVRAVARLVRPAIGSEYHLFNASVRAAADMLAPIRDAHAMRGTFDDLLVRQGLDDHRPFDAVRSAQSASVDHRVRGLDADDPRVIAARLLLKASRKRVKSWEIPDGFDALGTGISDTYRRGRKALRRVEKDSSDESVHRWRTSVKQLWYQVRLLERIAPSVLGAHAAALGDLADALGDDHDLALLIAELEADPSRFGGKFEAKTARRLAKTQQADLRDRAVRLGATLYAEHTGAFLERIETYWNTTAELGPERPTGGIAELAPDDETDEKDETDKTDESENDESEKAAEGSTIERERKYLVTEMPSLPEAGTELRQGYLAVDGTVSVRVRDAGRTERTLTIKAGEGVRRTELEWRISKSEFTAAWDQTRGRRVRKTRYRLPFDGHVIELDVFRGHLEGLVLAEVEFASDDAMEAFRPPAWFGSDVTDDAAFTNASLATGVPKGIT